MFAELAVTEDRDFERKVLPFIRLVWSDATAAPVMRSFDQAGIDILAWGDDSRLRLAVQCKGFRVAADELGGDQVDQCARSIAAFQRSEIPVDTYILLYNRDGRNTEFAKAVRQELGRLVDSGQAQRAELWDLNLFLRRSFAAVYTFVRDALAARSRSMAADVLENEPTLCVPLETVPLRTSLLVIDPYRLRDASRSKDNVSRPARELLALDKGVNISVLIGEAGFGKTTAALDALQNEPRGVLYLPARTIAAQTMGTKDLLQQTVELDELLPKAEPSVLEVFRRLARPAIEYVLKDPDYPVALIIDGIDESVFLSRRGGLQGLFNALREVRVPIVITARTEYWMARQMEFTTSFGMTAASKARRERNVRRVKLTELLPWRDGDILKLARRYREVLPEGPPRQHVDVLIESVASGQYAQLYGDIPRRPLFLRFILETVAEHGAQQVGKADLFGDWARMKIVRDVTAPTMRGGAGRISIAAGSDGVDATVELAFLAMRWAAFRMTQVNEGTLELLASCSVDDVLSAHPRLQAITDPTGLVLNSLLVPVSPRKAGDSLGVRFAHRAFQEFFLADILWRHPDLRPAATLPSDIEAWMLEFRVSCS